MSKVNKRIIILDIYLIDDRKKIASVVRDENDIYEKNIISAIILTLPEGNHPIDYIKKYIAKKGIKIRNKIKLLSSIYQNFFDSEPEVEYLVFSFLVNVEAIEQIEGDKENSKIQWLTLTEFQNHPKLMPEIKLSKIADILANNPIYYRGRYRDSDGSNGVISKDIF